MTALKQADADQSYLHCRISKNSFRLLFTLQLSLSNVSCRRVKITTAEVWLKIGCTAFQKGMRHMYKQYILIVLVIYIYIYIYI